MNKVKIKLHGALAKDAGRSEWNLRVKNVREAISGVQCHWKKFYSSLVENNKKHIGYRVLINGEECLVEDGKDPNSREGMRSSQLSLDEISNLKSIDIIPVIEGSDFMDIFTIFLAVVLIAVGLPPALGAAGFTSVYGAMVIAGVGLLVAGVANLLTPDPEFDDFLLNKIGYDKLSILMQGLFISPYAATSLREYFATGFTEFFMQPDHRLLRTVSPVLYKKLIKLYKDD